MSKLQEYLKSREEAFDEKFGTRGLAPYVFKSFHSQSLNGLLEMVIRIIEERKIQECGFEECICKEPDVQIENKILSDLAEEIKSVIKK